MAKDIHEVDIGTYRLSLRGLSPDQLRDLAKHLSETADAIEDEERRMKARRGQVYWTSSSTGDYAAYHFWALPNHGSIPA